MAIHITASGATTVSTSGPRGILVQVNAPLTGTITIADTLGTVAVLASVVPVGQYNYYGLNGTVTVNPSATCDISVSILSKKSS